MSKRREKTLAIIVAIIIAIWVIDRIILTPSVRWWRTKQEEVSVKNARLAKANALVRQRKKWRAALDDMRNSQLPSAPSEGEAIVIRTLRGTAADCGVNVQSMRPRHSHDSDDQPTIGLLLIGGGSMESIVHLVHSVETSSLPLRVLRFELGTGADPRRELRLMLEVEALLPGPTRATKRGAES